MRHKLSWFRFLFSSACIGLIGFGIFGIILTIIKYLECVK